MRVATLPTTLLHIVQIGDDQIWLHGRDALVFHQQPVHVFSVEADVEEEIPTALIFTTDEAPGNPEQHRARKSTEQIVVIFRDYSFLTSVGLDHDC